MSKFSAEELLTLVGGRARGIELIHGAGEHVLRVTPDTSILGRLWPRNPSLCAGRGQSYSQQEPVGRAEGERAAHRPRLQVHRGGRLELPRVQRRDVERRLARIAWLRHRRRAARALRERGVLRVPRRSRKALDCHRRKPCTVVKPGGGGRVARHCWKSAGRRRCIAT